MYIHTYIYIYIYILFNIYLHLYYNKQCAWGSGNSGARPGPHLWVRVPRDKGGPQHFSTRGSLPREPSLREVLLWEVSLCDSALPIERWAVHCSGEVRAALVQHQRNQNLQATPSMSMLDLSLAIANLQQCTCNCPSRVRLSQTLGSLPLHFFGAEPLPRRIEP